MLSNIPESDEKGSSNPGSFFTILKSKEECSMPRRNAKEKWKADGLPSESSRRIFVTRLCSHGEKTIVH